MDLLLVRHARPERIENTDGSPADPPLAASGREQAAQVAAWLADEQLDRIYASPMRRARETAAPLLASRGLEALLEPRVAEFDQNSEVYVPLEQLKAEDPERWRAFVQGGYGEGIDFESFCADVVNGHKIRRSDSWVRCLVGKVYAAAVRKAFDLPIRDIDCDFRLIRTTLVKQLDLQSDSGSICVELIAGLADLGAVFREVPVHHYARRFGKSEFFQFSRILRTIYQLFKLHKRRGGKSGRDR